MTTSSIIAEKGRNFLFKVNSSGASPPVYVAFTGLRATQLKINGNEVDITNKNSGGNQELLPDAGVRRFDMSCSGIYDATVGGVFAFVEAAALANSFVDGQIVYPSGVTFSGTFIISDFTTDGPYDNAQTFSLTIKSHGTLVRAP